MQTNTCERCSKKFESRYPRKFCSRDCANKTRAEKAQVWGYGKCKRCGKEFRYKPYRAHRTNEFCSRECSNLSRDITIGDIAKMRGQPPVSFICKNCGKEFTVLACYVKNKPRKFCSQKCNGESRIGKPTIHKTIGNQSFGKGGFRKDIGMYFRSRWEANYARYLIYKGKKFSYEPKTFIIAIPDGTSHAYTPDFFVESHYVEIKGWMRADRRQAEVISAAQGQIDRPLVLITKSGYRKIEREYAHKIKEWEYSGDPIQPKVERLCLHCGKRLTSPNPKSIYCSNKCSALHRTQESLVSFRKGAEKSQIGKIPWNKKR